MLKELEQIMKSRLPMPEKREAAKDIIKKYFNDQDVYSLIEMAIRNKSSNQLDGLLNIAINELIDEKTSNLDIVEANMIISKIGIKQNYLQERIDDNEKRLLSEDKKIELYQKLSEDDSNYKRTLYNYSVANSTAEEDIVAEELGRENYIRKANEEIKIFEDYKKLIDRNVKQKMSK